MKKKILFIAHNFPPSEVIADIRASNIAKYLVNDFDISVLTVDENYFIKRSNNLPNGLDDVKIIRVRYDFRLEGSNVKANENIPKIIRRILLKILPYLGFDFLSFWQRDAIKTILKKNIKYDFIIATGPPFSNFVLAKKIAKILNAKYILDYRDLWSYSPHASNINNILNQQREKAIIKDASLVTFVSSSMELLMKKKVNVKNSFVLSNGFDSETFKGISKFTFNKFTISYVGNFYPPKRIIDPLFKVFSLIKNERASIYSSIKFIYCGGNGKYIQDKAKEYRIEEILENRYLVSRSEALSITKSSNLSVVITSVLKEADLSDKSIITGKVFESIGLYTKILCISPEESDVRKIIEEHNGYNVNGNDITEIMNIIKKNYYLFLGEKRKKEKTKSQYEWKILINQLIHYLNKLKS